MKKLLVLVTAAVATLALAGAVQAGCMATIGLSSTPKAGMAAGTPWVVTIRVLQHGRRPMPDAKPEVRVRNDAGKLLVFKAAIGAQAYGLAVAGVLTSALGAYYYLRVVVYMYMRPAEGVEEATPGAALTVAVAVAAVAVVALGIGPELVASLARAATMGKL